MAYTIWEREGGLFFDIAVSAETKRPGVDGCMCLEYDTGKRFFWNDGAWEEAYSASGSGPLVKSGTVTLGAGASLTVAFATAFPVVPRVVVTSQFSSADTSTTLSCHSVTTGQFSLRGAGNAAGIVAWIATSAPND